MNTENAAQPYGAYSHAVEAGDLIFLSGHSGRDVKTGKVIEDDIEAQVVRAIENIAAVLEACRSSLKEVVRTTVYLADMSDFHRMDVAYAKFFPLGFPARSTIQVAALPFGARVALDAIAHRQR